MQTTELADSLKKRNDLHGEIITWDIRIPDVTVSDCQVALDAAKLSKHYATKLESSSAFTRASKHFKKDRVIDKIGVDATGDTIVYQITSKNIVDRPSGDKIMDHAYECKVLLDTRTNSVLCPENLTLEAEMQGHMTTAVEARTSSDVSRIVQKLFKDNADLFPINPNKGVAYFVPDSFREFTAQVEVFLITLGGTVSRFPVPKGTPHGNKSVMQAVSSGLEHLITELNEVVEEWDNKTRDATISKGIKKWRIIEHKLATYEMYLGTQKDLINKELQEAKGKLKEKGKALLAERNEKLDMANTQPA